MTPSILTYRQMSLIINIDDVDYKTIRNIIKKEYKYFSESCDKYHKDSMQESLKVIKRYSYIAFSYARDLNENDYIHFHNIIRDIFCNIMYDEYCDTLTKEGLREIAKEYYNYVCSFR